LNIFVHHLEIIDDKSHTSMTKKCGEVKTEWKGREFDGIAQYCVLRGSLTTPGYGFIPSPDSQRSYLVESKASYTARARGGGEAAQVEVFSDH
jgi:hypothetical protein